MTKHLEQVAVGEPGCDCRASALAHDARHLGGGRFRPAREHDPAGRDDSVELSIGERQPLGLAGAIVDVEAFGLGALARGRDQVSRDVSTGHLGSTPRDRPRGPAGSGCQVENTLAELGIEAQDTMFYGIGNAAADLVVVGAAGAPHGGWLFIVRLDTGSS
jgi:hypothetical protein